MREVGRGEAARERSGKLQARGWTGARDHGVAMAPMAVGDGVDGSAATANAIVLHVACEVWYLCLLAGLYIVLVSASVKIDEH